MDWYAFIMAFLFETVTTLPFRGIAYYPFRRQLRFSVPLTVFLLAVTQLSQSAFYAWVSTGSLIAGRTTEYIFSVICFLVYIASVKVNFWKILFLYVFVFDYTVIVRGIALFAESRLFADPLLVDSPVSILMTLIVFAATAPFMILYLRRTKDRIFLTSDVYSLWRVIWMLPTLTTLIVMLQTADISVESVRQVRFLLARVFLIAGMFVIYAVLFRALESAQHEAAMKEYTARQSLLLSMQRTQYGQLSRNLEETRRARHDLAQHLRIINSYLNSGDRQALREYVEIYGQSLPPDTRRTWCENDAVNILVSYYYEETEALGIDFTAKLDLPKQLPISDPEFCSVLGNLLENAMIACRDITEEAPFIRVLARMERGKIFLTVDNTSTDDPHVRIGRNDRERDDFALGNASVCSIAERYHGNAAFRYDRGVFYASVYFNFA